MSRIVVLGCGDLAWGRPTASELFGRQWSRGRFADRVQLPKGGGADGLGENWVSLAEELDSSVASHPLTPFAPALRIAVEHAASREAAQGAPLPSWTSLAGGQATRTTRDLGGPGVLVTPWHWLHLPAGRQLLEVWALEGWNWVAIEHLLRRRFDHETRFVAASGSWLRLFEADRQLIFANGDDAARAHMAAREVLAAARQQLGDELAARYRQEEEAASSWYTLQVVARRLIAALAAREPSVEMEAAGGELFRFSSVTAAHRYHLLTGLRFKIDLPPARSVWWRKVTEQGFLSDLDGRPQAGITWEQRPTVLLEGPTVSQLRGLLTFRGASLVQLDPSSLEEAIELGAALPPPTAPPVDAADEAAVAARAEVTPEAPAASLAAFGEQIAAPAAEGPPVPPRESVIGEVTSSAPPSPLTVTPVAADPAPELPVPFPQGAAAAPTAAAPAELLARLLLLPPHQFSLPLVHRPGHMWVAIDDVAVDPVHLRQIAPGGTYAIQGLDVGHGAVLRVDYEPHLE